MPPARTLWNRRIVMRDGAEIAADVMLPAGPGPWPALVNRTPYMRGRNLRPEAWMRLVDDGYAFVAVDVRGRGDSEGRFVPHVHDAGDGHDTIEWVAAQTWCTGRVGMVGGSYEGRTQWWTGKGRPPHLCCIVPQAVGAVRIGPRRGADTGVPVQYRIWWYNLVSGRTMQHPGAPCWEANFDHLPLRTLHERIGASREWWPRYVDAELEPLGPADVLSDDEWARFDVPALVGVGWWDDQTTMDTWMALRDAPAGPRSHLLIGAWDHAGNVAPRRVLGGLDVSASAIDAIGYIERFLALHLKDEAADLPRCRVFRTGAMEWEALDDWPSPDARPAVWHLHADGVLSEDEPGEDGRDTYRYDPADPVRDFSNLAVFAWSDPPLDARYLLRRPDVRVYTSDPLQRRVDVSGRAFFDGFVSTDCPDTDVVVHLHDVHPDGRSIEFGSSGLLRLAYRNGVEPEAMRPGEPVHVRIPITWLHHSFLTGHRIRLVVTSSAFPNNARNLNTAETWADAAEPRVAQVSIHRGPAQPSRLALPVEGG